MLFSGVTFNQSLNLAHCRQLSRFDMIFVREFGELVFLGLAAVSCCVVLNVVHRELAPQTAAVQRFTCHLYGHQQAVFLKQTAQVLQRLNLPIFLTIAGGLGVGQAAYMVQIFILNLKEQAIGLDPAGFTVPCHFARPSRPVVWPTPGPRWWWLPGTMWPWAIRLEC